MKFLPGLFLIATLLGLPAANAQTPKQVAQKLFDAMYAHDGVAATSLFLPGATLSSVDEKGSATVIPLAKFVERIANPQTLLREEMRNPDLLESGSIAVLWTGYVFKRDGKFSHCGIDVFQFLKTPDGWKIASLSYNRQTANCPD